MYIVAGIAGALLLLGLVGGVICYKTRTSQVTFFPIFYLSIQWCGRKTTFLLFIMTENRDFQNCIRNFIN